MKDIEQTRPTAETRSAEANEAQRDHSAATPVDPAASTAAPASVDPGVAEHEKEMNERGANQKGEGRI